MCLEENKKHEFSEGLFTPNYLYVSSEKRG